MAYFRMRLKLAKINVSNIINQVLPSLKTYQAHLYFSELPRKTYMTSYMNVLAHCLLNFNVRNYASTVFDKSLKT